MSAQYDRHIVSIPTCANHIDTEGQIHTVIAPPNTSGVEVNFGSGQVITSQVICGRDGIGRPPAGPRPLLEGDILPQPIKALEFVPFEDKHTKSAKYILAGPTGVRGVQEIASRLAKFLAIPNAATLRSFVPTHAAEKHAARVITPDSPIEEIQWWATANGDVLARWAYRWWAYTAFQVIIPKGRAPQSVFDVEAWEISQAISHVPAEDVILRNGRLNPVLVVVGTPMVLVGTSRMT